MQHVKPAFLSVLTLTLLGACGDPPLQPGESWDRILDGFCESAHRCMNDPTSEFDPIFHGSSVDACVENWHRGFGTPDEVAASVEAGRIEFDAEVADITLQLLEDDRCEVFWDTLVSKEPTFGFFASVPVGGACTINGDCEGGFPECYGNECVDHDEE